MFGSVCAWRSESTGIHQVLKKSSSTNEKFFVSESKRKHQLRINDKNWSNGGLTSNRIKV
jgi:hypothetical protein